MKVFFKLQLVAMMLILSGCSLFTKTEYIPTITPITCDVLDEPAPLKMRKVNVGVDGATESVTLTMEDYEALSLNLSDILNNIIGYRAVIDGYRGCIAYHNDLADIQNKP